MKTGLLAKGLLVLAAASTLAFRGSGDDRARVWDVRRYPSGALMWKRSWVNGLKDGTHQGWWENGNRKFEYRFVAGDYEGVAREWYPDGKLAKEMRYRHGREAGLQRAWRENGTLYANYEARDGRLYGVVNARLCYSVKDGAGVFRAAR